MAKLAASDGRKWRCRPGIPSGGGGAEQALTPMGGAVALPQQMRGAHTPDAERRSLLVGGAGGAQHHEEVNDRIRDVKADLEGEAHCQQPRAEVGTGASGNRRKWEQA